MARKTGEGRKPLKTTTIFVHLFAAFLALGFFGMMVGIITQSKPGQFVIDNFSALSSLCIFLGTVALLYFSKYHSKRRRSLVNAIYAASTRVTAYLRPEAVVLEQLRNELEKKRERRKRRKRETAIRRSRKSTA